MFIINIFNVVASVLILCVPNAVLAFNLSPVPNLIIKMPNATTKLPKFRSSYFGYSIVLRRKSIIIAAPRAQSTIKAQLKINETGAIYKCPLRFNGNQIAEGEHSCRIFPIDSEGNYYANHYLKFEIKDHQWLGGSMDGGPNDDDPLLICAPHFVGGYDFMQENEYFHGICYWTRSVGDDSKPIIVKKLKSLTDRTKQSYTSDGVFLWNYQLGEQGFSAHITPNNREFLMGAPGVDQWKGSVVHYDIATERTKIPTKFLRSFSYGGYAVSSGYLDSDNRDRIIYVATTPHSTSNEFNMGEAILFDFSPMGNAIEKKAVLRGTKYGEYFGYVVVVDDVNSDDMDDLIVSAPLYTSDDTIDIGAVYMFLNTGRFFFTLKIIESPFRTPARFGTTLSKLGDINRDGYPDIAIGAPFTDGHGAVAIYLGGPDGLQDTPSQILGVEPSSMQAIMFGHGLSKGVDIDGNGFNDLAIGAPECEIVYIYRAYPVVNIKVRITPQKRRLELNDSELKVEFCFQMESESATMESIEIQLEIEIDTKMRRLKFRESSDNRFALKINATKDKECQSFVSLVKFLPAFIFTPMELVLRYNLANDAQQYGLEEFCTKCAVLEPTSRREARSRVTYEHGCKGAICKVDLKIKALKMPANFTLGSSKILYVEYFIENSGERAFDAKIEITTSLNISHAKIPSNCMEDTEYGNKLICNLFYSLGFTGSTTIEIGFDMSHVPQISRMNITAVALSGGNEIEPNDNSLNSTIEFYTSSALEIVGESNETFVSITGQSTDFKVFYKFKLKNNGPSPLYNIKLSLFVPSAYTDAKNYSNRFLIPETSYANSIANGNNLPTIIFKLVNATWQIDGTIVEQRTHVVEQFLPRIDTLTLNSTNAKYFANANITNIRLESGQSMEMNLILNVESKSLINILKKRFDYLELVLDIVVVPRSKEHLQLNITKILSPLVLVNIAPPSTPIWVYIVSVIGGLTLVTLMAFGLRKLGFFKRQTKEDMEEMINEKLERARMKAELESEISATDD